MPASPLTRHGFLCFCACALMAASLRACGAAKMPAPQPAQVRLSAPARGGAGDDFSAEPALLLQIEGTPGFSQGSDK